jgi:Na+/H+ antiporter NhaD/arsenite permease-like protein
LITDLFLLAISAIGRTEVRNGTLGANGLAPIDIIAFVISIAYITISIDASGVLRYFLFKTLQLTGNVGHKVFFYLYALFFGFGTLLGDDLVVLSGTAFLAYFTRVTSNIIHPRAWIHTQFAVAKISTAVLVTSNPANLIIANTFNIRFVHYTANMIVPVFVTAIVLFPFLLYFIFADEALIPLRLLMHELSEELKAKIPINSNIPHARSSAKYSQDTEGKLLALEEIMNPFLDVRGAVVGVVIIIATLITVLTLNAKTEGSHEHPVFWVTVPAAFILFCCDVASGWLCRFETRRIARQGRQVIQRAQAEQAIAAESEHARIEAGEETAVGVAVPSDEFSIAESDDIENRSRSSNASSNDMDLEMEDLSMHAEEGRREIEHREQISRQIALRSAHHLTLVSLLAISYEWCQETFPTAAAVVSNLPYSSVPFTFGMFVLVEALVARGWVAVFAYGWDHWVNKTGTLGALGGMGFLSVVLCNVGTISPISIVIC